MSFPVIDLVTHPKLLSVSIKVQLNPFSSGKDQSLAMAQIYVKFVSGKALVDLKHCKNQFFSDWLLDLILIPEKSAFSLCLKTRLYAVCVADTSKCF